MANEGQIPIVRAPNSLEKHCHNNCYTISVGQAKEDECAIACRREFRVSVPKVLTCGQETEPGPNPMVTFVR
jgi:hypothetical protein